MENGRWDTRWSGRFKLPRRRPQALPRLQRRKPLSSPTRHSGPSLRPPTTPGPPDTHQPSFRPFLLLRPEKLTFRTNPGRFVPTISIPLILDGPPCLRSLRAPRPSPQGLLTGDPYIGLDLTQSPTLTALLGLSPTLLSPLRGPVRGPCETLNTSPRRRLRPRSRS